MPILFSQFLILIDNKEVWWKFNIIGDVSITGQLIDYLLHTDGKPLTLKVRQENRVVVEIPWTSIQFITGEKPENY